MSKQFHYDFGMRALKSVLVMAGGLKRQYQDMQEDLGSYYYHHREYLKTFNILFLTCNICILTVLMRCLRDSNMPKFVFEDVPLFIGKLYI